MVSVVRVILYYSSRFADADSMHAFLSRKKSSGKRKLTFPRRAASPKQLFWGISKGCTAPLSSGTLALARSQYQRTHLTIPRAKANLNLDRETPHTKYCDNHRNYQATSRTPRKPRMTNPYRLDHGLVRRTRFFHKRSTCTGRHILALGACDILRTTYDLYLPSFRTAYPLPNFAKQSIGRVIHPSRAIEP